MEKEKAIKYSLTQTELNAALVSFINRNRGMEYRPLEAVVTMHTDCYHAASVIVTTGENELDA